MSPLRVGLALLLPIVALLAGCRGGSNDAAFARYLEAESRPIDPSIRVQFGHGKLPVDFPPGLPVPAHAMLLGWTRSTSSTALAWEAIYTAHGDTGTTAATLEDDLAGHGWQVRDRADVHGFQSLDLSGIDANDGRSAQLSVGPAYGGVQVVEDVSEAIPAGSAATPSAGSR